MSLINLRERLGARMRDEESGFTLVELLVVMLILGLLAAIAIPAFFNQRDKARDADAKSAARTAQTAIETYATDNGGEYADATVVDLRDIEPTLNDATLTDPLPLATASEYTVEAQSDTGNLFRITRSADGTTELTCDDGDPDAPAGGEAGCPDDGIWGN